MKKVNYVHGVNSFKVSKSTVKQFSAAIRDSIAEANQGGQFFTVWFTKADGTVRKMNCRTGVTQYLKGGDSTLNGKANILQVYDVKVGGYRCFKAETLLRIRQNGKEIIFE